MVTTWENPIKQNKIQYSLYYPTLYYLNFQLSDLKPTLPTPFKPIVLAPIIQPNCNYPKRVKYSQHICLWQFCIMEDWRPHPTTKILNV